MVTKMINQVQMMIDMWKARRNKMKEVKDNDEGSGGKKKPSLAAKFPKLLVFFMDTMIWYFVFYTVSGGVYGVLHHLGEQTEYLLSRLNFIPHTLFEAEVSYMDFLNRVHLSEIKLREKGLWDVPHPWLNLLVPKSNIYTFAKEVFGGILTETSNGPILIYPVNQSRWNSRTSLVTSEEDVFYLVAFLTSAMPSSTGSDGLEQILAMNKRIIDFYSLYHCES